MLDLSKLKPYIGIGDTNVCYKNGVADPLGDKIELTVQLTNKCNSKCTFCSNSLFKDYDFDINKFMEVFNTLNSNYTIAKVAFTGGEPTLHPDFVKLVKFVRTKLPRANIVVNTNASHLEVLEEITGLDIEFGISRHHFDDNKNWEIFKSSAPAGSKDLKNFSEKENVLLHCNLIKGYIDSIDKCVDYINWCKENGFKEVGFVELMPYTQAAIDDKATIKVMDFPVEKFVITRFAERKGICNCMNGIYNGVRVYNRKMCASNCKNIVSTPLVYNLNKLSKGFGGDIIWDLS